MEPKSWLKQDIPTKPIRLSYSYHTKKAKEDDSTITSSIMPKYSQPKAHRIPPPTTQQEWHDMLVQRRHKRLHHTHRQHHKERNTIKPMSDPATQDRIEHDNHDYRHFKPREQKNRSCQPQHDWQTQSFPICNVLHEHSIMPDHMFLKPFSFRDAGYSKQDTATISKASSSEMEEQVRFIAHGHW
jgi:hypothetical protein